MRFSDWSSDVCSADLSVKREGRDVTVVAIGVMVRHAMRAAATLSEEGIEVEVVDPITLFPLDKELILASVRKTGRLVILDEARAPCSAARDIAASVPDQGRSEERGVRKEWFST